jgi:hypothetical protein
LRRANDSAVATRITAITTIKERRDIVADIARTVFSERGTSRRPGAASSHPCGFDDLG